MFLIRNKIKNISGDTFDVGYLKGKFSRIYRFQAVDNVLYRGSKPDKDDIKILKEMGVGTIIDFTNDDREKRREITEKEIAESLGIKYINLPFPAYKNPSDEYVNMFFNVMQEARDKKEKVYIHCMEGKDRTGLFAAMYKLKYNLSDLPSCIREMINMGHNELCFPNLIEYLKKFYYNIQPDLNMQADYIINKGIVEKK